MNHCRSEFIGTRPLAVLSEVHFGRARHAQMAHQCRPHKMGENLPFFPCAWGYRNARRILAVRGLKTRPSRMESFILPPPNHDQRSNSTFDPTNPTNQPHPRGWRGRCWRNVRVASRAPRLAGKVLAERTGGEPSFEVAVEMSQTLPASA
jgi:hypothetical protein